MMIVRLYQKTNHSKWEMQELQKYALYESIVIVLHFNDTSVYVFSPWFNVHLIPWQASQRLTMSRYATGTATEIQTQRDSNPVLTSASQQVAGMQFSSH